MTYLSASTWSTGFFLLFLIYPILLQFPPLDLFETGCSVKKKNRRNPGILLMLRFVWRRWCIESFKAAPLNCLTVPTLCLAWTTHVALSQGLQKLNFTHSFCMQQMETLLWFFLSNAVGTRRNSQPATGAGFYKAMACLFQSGKGSAGYPTIALLMLDLFQCYNVQAMFYKPV